MECVICKTGTTQPGKTTYSIVKNNRVIIIQDVRADICENCGEAYFSPETSEWLSKKVNEAVQNSSTEEVIRI
jgi:YgiT-type zinc finger domain-containing protein